MRKFWCFLLGHRWHWVYVDPCSQYPIHVMRENPSALDGIEMKIECYRCRKESWR
jgi:hypothetical protein